jgi:hypothetical protein
MTHFPSKSTSTLPTLTATPDFSLGDPTTSAVASYAALPICSATAFARLSA